MAIKRPTTGRTVRKSQSITKLYEKARFDSYKAARGDDLAARRHHRAERQMRTMPAANVGELVLKLNVLCQEHGSTALMEGILWDAMRLDPDIAIPGGKRTHHKHHFPDIWPNHKTRALSTGRRAA